MAALITPEGVIIEDYAAETFSQWTDVVGGYVEVVYLKEDMVLLINEEGILMSLPYNLSASILTDYRHKIFGNAILMTLEEFSD
jgi:hypothetical protein